MLLISTNHNESLLINNQKCAEAVSSIPFLLGFPSEEVVLYGNKLEKVKQIGNNFVSFCFIGEGEKQERKCFHNNVVNCVTRVCFLFFVF